MNRHMKSKLALIFLASGLFIAEASAQGFSRSGGGTGPRGNSYTSQGSGACTGTKCSSQQSITGPRGRTAKRANTAQCSGGKCTTSHAITGPRGRSFTRGSTITRN